eukprot:CAMPEP_0168264606 /NCGR_PEP_ID=MMETSP0141_2-20121125/11246_1 /TAXON_ID=44445 /ORGANISM="Pseudo-nitzschia australis, Strain 10249 10 AB" /LENGTH=284 /DNA_ID=CAMNT_0008203921 /DNA_START=18 /DNA_END=872 /DNA_ORIENTATION=-
MNSDILANASSMTLPLLEFVTPQTSPIRRIDNVGDNNEPPALKRKRTPSIDTHDASLPSLNTNFPFLTCADFCDGPAEDKNEINMKSSNSNKSIATTPSIPKITLLPRQKKSRRARLLVFPQKLQHDLYQETNSNSKLPLRRRKRRMTIPTTRTMDYNDRHSTSNTTPTIATAVKSNSNSLGRSLSSRSIGRNNSSSSSTMPRKPSFNMTRSLSLQFNLSLMNLAAAATGSSSNLRSSNNNSNMPRRLVITRGIIIIFKKRDGRSDMSLSLVRGYDLGLRCNSY